MKNFKKILKSKYLMILLNAFLTGHIILTLFENSLLFWLCLFLLICNTFLFCVNDALVDSGKKLALICKESLNDLKHKVEIANLVLCFQKLMKDERPFSEKESDFIALNKEISESWKKHDGQREKSASR